MNAFVVEIENILAQFPVQASAYHTKDYIGGGHSKLRYLGLRVPQLNQAMQNGFSFSSQKENRVAKIWNEVWWNSECYEVMALALSWFYHPKQKPLLRKHWPKLKKWSSRIDNWAHSDVLSGIYARILEEAPNDVYPTLCQWNQSKNPWLRRLSIVSLLYYSAQRKKVLPLNKILRLVKPLIPFDHYYVQKGVGWTLREAGNVYPEETFSFLERHIRDLSPSAYSAATEKITKAQRDHLKKLRKALR